MRGVRQLRGARASSERAFSVRVGGCPADSESARLEPQIKLHGRITVQGDELDRIEVRLKPDATGTGVALKPDTTATDVVRGYSREGEELKPLPIGSHLDAATGVFTWSPGVGFVHGYDLVFVRCQGDSQSVAQPFRAAAADRGAQTDCTRHEVRIVLHPKGSNRLGPQITIDTPVSRTDGVQPLLVAGWAVDLDASSGTGVDAVHVWAYPVNGPSTRSGQSAAPQFVGAATYGGIRPDVGAVLGEPFTPSGYALRSAITSLANLPFRCPLAAENHDSPIEVRQLLYGRRAHVYRILFTV